MGKVKLGDVCEILDNQRIPITASERKKGIYPYYGANGIQDYVDGYIFDDELVLLAEDGGNFGSKEKPIAYRVSGKCWVNNHAHVLKPKAGLNVDYLCYSLMFCDVSNIVNGATRQKLTQADMKEIEIPLLPLGEQFVIVEKLNKIFALISLRKQQLQKLDELVKSRFVELFGDIVLNPNEFEEGVVSEYCKMTQGTQIPMSEQRTDYQQGYYRYLYIRDLKYNDDNWIYVRDKYDDKKLTSKDLVVVNTGNTAGEIYYGKDGILSNNLFKVSFDSNVLDTTYMFAYFSSQQFQNMLWSEMKEGTQPHLGHKIFGSKKLLVPPMELQQQFTTFVEQTDKSKFEIQKSLEKLEILKKSLMQKYFG